MCILKLAVRYAGANFREKVHDHYLARVEQKTPFGNLLLDARPASYFHKSGGYFGPVSFGGNNYVIDTGTFHCSQVAIILSQTTEVTSLI